MVIVNSQDVLKALDAFPAMIRNANKQLPRPALVNANPERFLLYSWTQAGIAERLNRFDRVMYTCMAMPGDQTSKTKRHMTDDGVYIKYQEEYRPCIRSCKKRVYPDPEVYCPLRHLGHRDLVDAWNEAQDVEEQRTIARRNSRT